MEFPPQERVLRLDHFNNSGPYSSFVLESLEWLSDLPLQHGQPCKARIHFSTRVPVVDITIGIGFSGLEGKRLLTYDTDFPDGLRPSIPHPGSYSVDIQIELLPLGPDLYSLDIGARSGDFYSLAYIPASAQLEVIAGPDTPGAIVRKDLVVRLSSKRSWMICHSSVLINS